VFRLRVIVTCEHGGNRVPRWLAARFQGADRVLASHRGWDPGALPLARTLARRLGVVSFASTITRLAVDLNRSLTNPAVFSAFTRVLDAADRRRLLESHYFPHRRRVERAVSRGVARGRVLHVAVHSFVPTLGGVRRAADIGLLYDPSRDTERRFCAAWRAELLRRDARLRVRMNYPYRGVSDGLTTALRRRFQAGAYLGIELEVNQHHLTGKAAGRAAFCERISAALGAAAAAQATTKSGGLTRRPGVPRLRRPPGTGAPRARAPRRPRSPERPAHGVP
jgi:predicted N-formylglutamate amidohydrolase